METGRRRRVDVAEQAGALQRRRDSGMPHIVIPTGELLRDGGKKAEGQRRRGVHHGEETSDWIVFRQELESG
jgi:hypothetical protein